MRKFYWLLWLIISSGTFGAIRKSYATLLIFANFVKQFLFKDLPILIAHILHSNCLSYDYRKQVTKYLPKGLLTINISTCSTASFVVIQLFLLLYGVINISITAKQEPSEVNWPNFFFFCSLQKKWKDLLFHTSALQSFGVKG